MENLQIGSRHDRPRYAGTGMVRRTTALAALVAAVVGVLARRRFTRFEIVEESMAPALLPGDYLFARRQRGPLARGQVVMFEHPHRDGFFLVKRVVAVGGESVDISGGQVNVDGRPLAEPWADGPTTDDGHWELRPSEVFVLGDARVASADDSRTLGPLAAEGIEWRAAFRYWPPLRLGRPAAL